MTWSVGAVADGGAAAATGRSRLTGAFLAQGATAVVSSLWRTEPAARGMLMGALYRELLLGRTRAEALRHAKLELLDDPVARRLGWHLPHHWADLVLEGDPGAAR